MVKITATPMNKWCRNSSGRNGYPNQHFRLKLSFTIKFKTFCCCFHIICVIEVVTTQCMIHKSKIFFIVHTPEWCVFSSQCSTRFLDFLQLFCRILWCSFTISNFYNFFLRFDEHCHVRNTKFSCQASRWLSNIVLCWWN